jgi:hypothetical protein
LDITASPNKAIYSSNLSKEPLIECYRTKNKREIMARMRMQHTVLLPIFNHLSFQEATKPVAESSNALTIISRKWHVCVHANLFFLKKKKKQEKKANILESNQKKRKERKKCCKY